MQENLESKQKRRPSRRLSKEKREVFWRYLAPLVNGPFSAPAVVRRANRDRPIVGLIVDAPFIRNQALQMKKSGYQTRDYAKDAIPYITGHDPQRILPIFYGEPKATAEKDSAQSKMVIAILKDETLTDAKKVRMTLAYLED